MIIAVKIDVKKIDKERLFAGNKGTYLDAIIHLNDAADKYGNNGMVVQSVSKEERAKGIKGAILGNVQILSKGNSAGNTQQTQAAPPPSDDLPF